MHHLPNYCETKIINVYYFLMNLPVTAFGFHDNMVMQLSVEYSDHAGNGLYAVDVWAGQKGGTSRHFLYSITIPKCDEVERAIVEKLNEDDTFYDIMCDYIQEAAKHRID